MKRRGDEGVAGLRAALGDVRGRQRRRALVDFGAQWCERRGAAADDADVDAVCDGVWGDVDEDVRLLGVSVLGRLAASGALSVAQQQRVFVVLSAVVVGDASGRVRSAACEAVGLLAGVGEGVAMRVLSKCPCGGGSSDSSSSAELLAKEAREESLPERALATGDIDLVVLRKALLEKKKNNKKKRQQARLEGIKDDDDDDDEVRVLGGKECVGAGAFVHAVEDECAAVRGAAVRAMAAMSERWVGGGGAPDRPADGRGGRAWG